MVLDGMDQGYSLGYPITAALNSGSSGREDFLGCPGQQGDEALALFAGDVQPTMFGLHKIGQPTSPVAFRLLGRRCVRQRLLFDGHLRRPLAANSALTREPSAASNLIDRPGPAVCSVSSRLGSQDRRSSESANAA
jgi:hypothetical protein